MKKILLIAISLLLFGCTNSKPSDSDVKEAARAAILNNLKDMGSAKFHHNENIQDLGNQVYRYQETVNANNSFGGSIGQNVVVTLKWTGQDPSEVTSYILQDLQFNER